MVQKVDYFAVLSRAVEQLERDAYAARGAIYDREHKALLKRLISSSAPCSDADIAREENAFRDAVRRIEFPDNEARSLQTARREPAETWANAVRERARARRDLTPEPIIEPERANPRPRRRPLWESEEEAIEETPPVPQLEDGPRRPIGPQIDFQAGEREFDDPDWDMEEQIKPQRPFLKVVLIYVLVTAVVFGAAGLGYAYVMGLLDFSRLRTQATAPTEQALLFEGDQAGSGKPVPGRATWQTRIEPGKSDLIVSLEAEIADPPVTLSMTLARVTDPSSGMTHLFDLTFRSPAEAPLGAVSRVSNIAMRASQDSAGQSLGGTSINTAPGQFLFGLLSVADVVRDNLQLLRTDDWLDFTLVFANGATYTLSIQKGASGERAMSDALASWGQ